VAATFAIPAAFRAPRDPATPRFGRAIYGLLPLPMSGGARTLLDGFAIVSAVLAAQACVSALAWLGASPRDEIGRTLVPVPHAGVLALALLLFVDAVLVGGPTPSRSLAVVPPLLLGGSALGALLLYRSYGREPFLHLGMLLAVGASMLGFAQRALLGPELV